MGWGDKTFVARQSKMSALHHCRRLGIVRWGAKVDNGMAFWMPTEGFLTCEEQQRRKHGDGSLEVWLGDNGQFPGFMGTQVDALGRRFCFRLSHPVCTHKLGESPLDSAGGLREEMVLTHLCCAAPWGEVPQEIPDPYWKGAGESTGAEHLPWQTPASEGCVKAGHMHQVALSSGWSPAQINKFKACLLSLVQKNCLKKDIKVRKIAFLSVSIMDDLFFSIFSTLFLKTD